MKRILTSWWTVSILTTVLLILLFAVGLPLFVGFLKPWYIRLAVALLFVAIWGLWFFLRRRKAKKRNAELEKQLEQQDKGAEEAGVVAKRMKDALKKLREATGKQRNYLYTRPWYVIIGPPGAGKTTAMVNSGLRFPFSDKAANATAGTRNLDFWFADEAVLVDTAGRYTTQDSQADVDASGWTSLLELLRKSRPFEPVNGVFVAIPADDLLRGDVREIDRHAVIIRQRLHEIRSKLEVKLPVYLLLTKSDLISGFPEYFADLDVDGRRAVFGHTFDRQGALLDSDMLMRAFDRMTNEIAARQPKRLQEEPDIRRRSVILGFPSQLHELRAPLHRLIEGAFLKEERPSGELRGFYLTSGTQDGASLDRIINTVAQSYAMDAGPAQTSEGRTFFLNRLLQDVVFKEAGLPIADASATKRQRNMMIGICSGIAVATLATMAAWTVSFINNRGFQAETATAAIEIEQEMQRSQLDLLRVSDTDTPLPGVLDVLDRLRALPEGYDARQEGGPPLLMRFGLFQSDLSKRNVEAYRTGLRRILLPRVMLELEERLRSDMSDPFSIYDPLKTYLMLGGHHPQGEVNTDAVTNTMLTHWAQRKFPGAENAPLRDNLARHLAALTEDENLQSSWANNEAPLDALLVDAARGQLATLSPADRAYAILKQQSLNPEKDIRLSNELQPGEAAAFADPQLVLDTTVPYFFTREGFTLAYGAGLATIPSKVEDELWVLGEGGDTDGIRRELGNLTSGISKRYASDYIAAWENVIAAMRPGDYFNDEQAYRAFTRAPSPLKKVLSKLRENTTFDGGAEGEIGKIAERAVDNNRIGRIASDIGGAAAERGMSADNEITLHFREIHNFVGDGEGEAPVDEYVSLVRDALKAVLVSGSDGLSDGSSASRLAEAMAPLSQAALEVPALLTGFAEQVAEGGSSARISSLQTEVGEAWVSNVRPACTSIIDAKYPFDPQSTADAGITETREVFGTNGTLDRFVKDRVDQYLDREGEYWDWRDDTEIARGFSPASPGAFQKASTLSSLFNEGLPLEIALAGKGAEVSRVEFSSGGLTMVFDEADPDQGQSLVWTLGGGLARTTELKIYSQGEEEGAREEVIWRQQNEGPWSLFRMFDRADARNRAEGLVQMTFNPGPSNATFLVAFPPRFNPFGGGGVWSINCPEVL